MVQVDVRHLTAKPIQNKILNRSAVQLVPASAALSVGPRWVNTTRVVRMASGRDAHVSRESQGITPSAAASGRTRYAPVMQSRYWALVIRSPRRTASVCLPAFRSFSRSRKLLTTRIAVMINPGGIVIHHAADETKPACT